MPKLIVTRTSEYLNKFRDYGIYIDGKKAGAIANGETKEFDVPAGPHTVFTRIDWCSSPTFSLNMSNGETKRLLTGGFKNGRWLMPAGLALIVLSFILNRLFAFNYLFFLVIPIFLILVYYMSIGRKQYLSLSENKSEGQNSMALQ